VKGLFSPFLRGPKTGFFVAKPIEISPDLGFKPAPFPLDSWYLLRISQAPPELVFPLTPPPDVRHCQGWEVNFGLVDKMIPNQSLQHYV